MTPKQYKTKIERVQNKLEKMLAKEQVSLVANYNKETNVVMLELVPVEMLAERNAMIDQLMKEKGDKIETSENSNNGQ